MASPTTLLSLGFLLLTGNSVMAINRCRGDPTAMIFVVASYLSLLLLFYYLRWFEMAAPGSVGRDRARAGVWLTTTVLTAMFSWRVASLMPWLVAGRPALTKLGFAVLVCNSALAIRNSWGDAGSVAFVLAADAALVLLFICLRAFERARGGAAGRSAIKAAVWGLTTLLTVRFASRVAPLMPPVVAAVVWLLTTLLSVALAWKEAAIMPPAVAGLVWGLAIATTVGGFYQFRALFPSPRAGDWQHMDRKSALAMITFAVLTYISAIGIHDTRSGAGAKAFVFVAYAGLTTMVCLFLAKFNHRQGQDEGRGVGSHEAAHGDVRIDGGAAGSGRGGLGRGGGHGRRRVLQLALATTAFGVLTCDSALAIHDTSGDAGSKAFVFVAYAGLATTITLFLREFKHRANGGELGVGGVA